MPHYDDDIPLRCSCGCTTGSHARDLRGGKPGPCSTHSWCKNFDPNGPKHQSEYERGYDQAKKETAFAVKAAYDECAQIATSEPWMGIGGSIAMKIEVAGKRAAEKP